MIERNDRLTIKSTHTAMTGATGLTKPVVVIFIMLKYFSEGNESTAPSRLLSTEREISPVPVIENDLPFPSNSSINADEAFTSSNWLVDITQSESLNNINDINDKSSFSENISFSTPPSTVGGEESVGLDLNLEECVDSSNNRQLRGKEGIINFSFSPSFGFLTHSPPFACGVELIVPQEMVAQVEVVDVSSFCFGNTMELRDEDDTVIFEGCPDDLPTLFVTYSNVLRIRVELLSNRFPFELHLTFFALLESSRPQLQMNYTSPTTGNCTG